MGAPPPPPPCTEGGCKLEAFKVVFELDGEIEGRETLKWKIRKSINGRLNSRSGGGDKKDPLYYVVYTLIGWNSRQSLLQATWSFPCLITSQKVTKLLRGSDQVALATREGRISLTIPVLSLYYVPTIPKCFPFPRQSRARQEVWGKSSPPLLCQ